MSGSCPITKKALLRDLRSSIKDRQQAEKDVRSRNHEVKQLVEQFDKMPFRDQNPEAADVKVKAEQAIASAQEASTRFFSANDRVVNLRACKMLLPSRKRKEKP